MHEVVLCFVGQLESRLQASDSRILPEQLLETYS